MNNTQLVIKVRQRLNKLASNDFDNIECWQIVEAFNKAQLEWCRRQLRGANQHKDGDERSTKRVDDLQILLREQQLLGPQEIGNQATQYNLPINDYMEYKRTNIFVDKECCEHDPQFGRRMQVYLAEAGNVDLLLRDTLRQPSYAWNETFCTMQNNTMRIYHNGDFTIQLALLQYYRYPVNVQIENCTDPITGGVSGNDVECEFKEDVAELIVDDAVSILAGDVADINNYMRGSQQAEKNN